MTMRDDGLPKAACLETVAGPRDYHFGRETAFDSGESSVYWPDLIPKGEIQYQRKRRGSLDKRFDTSACVTFTVANAAETVFRRLLAAGRISPSQLATLERHGFVAGGDLNISDRDLAARAGTTQDGNNFARVCETLRTVGPIPDADHPFEESLKTWEEYMVPGPELPEKRAAFLEVFDVQWEWLFLPSEGLTHQQKIERINGVIGTAPVLASSPICPGWSRYTAKEGVPIDWCGKKEGGHATLHLSNLQLRFDHYEPFVKTLAPDYWINHAARLTLVPRAPKPKPAPSLPSGPVQFGDRLADVTKLQDCLERLGYLKVKSDPKRPYFGPRTAEALLAFQIAERVDSPAELKRLGGLYYGPKSAVALKRALAVA